MGVLITLMVLMYPPLAHWSVHYNKPEYAVYLLGLLLLLPALLNIFRSRQVSLGAGVAIIMGLALLWFPGLQGISLVQLMPVVINGLLCGLFANSLRHGNTALITRIALLMHRDSIPQRVVDYTRKVSAVWTLFFFFLALSNLLLALFAPVEVWSLFANLLSYVLIGCLFLVEFFFRRRQLGDWVDYSFVDFIKGIVHLDYARIFRGQ